MKLKKIKPLVTSLFFLAFLVFSCVSTNATTQTDFNGGYVLVSNNGSAGTIEVQNPYVYGTDIANSVSAWVMTLDSTVTTRFAQVGWRKVAGWSAPKYFYEYAYVDNSIWYRKDLNTATSGANDDHMVGCDSTTMYFKINGTQVGSVSLSTIPFTRNTVEILGETHDTENQCPGSVTNPVSIGSAQYKNTSNSWVTGSYVKYPSGITTMQNNIPSSGRSYWEMWDSRYY